MTQDKNKIHEDWISFRRRFYKVKEPTTIKITNSEVEAYIYEIVNKESIK